MTDGVQEAQDESELNEQCRHCLHPRYKHFWQSTACGADRCKCEEFVNRRSKSSSRAMIAAVSGAELRRALAEVEKAEQAGFVASEAVFYLTAENSIWHVGAFSDVCEKGHPTDGKLDWGRDNFLARRGFTLRDGQLITPSHEYAKCTLDKSRCSRPGAHCAECGLPKNDKAANHKLRTKP